MDIVCTVTTERPDADRPGLFGAARREHDAAAHGPRAIGLRLRMPVNPRVGLIPPIIPGNPGRRRAE